MLTLGQTLVLAIEKPAAGGRMIARADGQVVLVGGVIPGEQATVRIDRLGKGVAYAEPVAIEAPSPDRREPDGDPLCGGCLFAHIAYPRQLALKAEIVADALLRIGKIAWPDPIAVAPSSEAGYRMRARLHVRGSLLGFFREGTHTICDARMTRQLLPDTSAALDGFAAAWIASGSSGDLELELSENVSASERALHLELVPSTRMNGTGWVDGLEGFSGVTSGSQGSATALSGSPYITERLSVDGHELVLRHHVLAFFQGNRYVLQDLVRRVAGEIAPDDTLIDLYAGVGLFSVAAASRGARVVAVEGDRVSADDLLANARAADTPLEAVHQPVEDFLARAHAAPRVLLVDPPRTGMSKEAIERAIGLRADRVVYVSCDVATFARDARRLIGAGYTLDSVEAFDLFPNTPHVETVAHFARR